MRAAKGEAAGLLRWGRGLGWRGSKLPSQLPPKPAPGPGLGISQKGQKSFVNISCPAPAPFLALTVQLRVTTLLTCEAIFPRELSIWPGAAYKCWTHTALSNPSVWLLDLGK